MIWFSNNLRRKEPFDVSSGSFSIDMLERELTVVRDICFDQQRQQGQ